ncbi:hypothetical protein [Phytohabitans suffuscus]|uniref:hypothetical protein n=1 Tax=Phytohabitans suffuscus TaxID=624315 RepID=UPI001E3A7243|nr:hypothetical protein [Phytohabitans suffuscus]
MAGGRSGRGREVPAQAGLCELLVHLGDGAVDVDQLAARSSAVMGSYMSCSRANSRCARYRISSNTSPVGRSGWDGWFVHRAAREPGRGVDV